MVCQGWCVMKDEFTPALRRMMEGKFINKTISKMATNVKSRAKENIMRKRKYKGGVIQDRGDLSKSIERIRVEKGHYRVVVTEPHGVYVHEGTRPHYPPFRPIREWVSRKLGIKQDPAQYLVTRSIIENIGKHGTEARPFLLDAMKDKATVKEFQKIFDREIWKEMRK